MSHEKWIADNKDINLRIMPKKESSEESKKNEAPTNESKKE